MKTNNMVSLRNLHLQYRLWIAEMNADINVLRIFNDYLTELNSKNNCSDTAGFTGNYNKTLAL